MNASPTGSPRPHVENPDITASPRPPRRRHTGLWIGIIVLLLLGLVWWINHRQAAQSAGGPPGSSRSGGGGRGGRGGFGGPNAPLPVGTHIVGKGDLHVYLDALGTVTAAHAATIRTQINGQLQQIAFKEGQIVHEGDLLAVIDPRPYENQLAQAQAQLAQAQAQLQTSQADLQRYETLAQQDSIARQQVDTMRAQATAAQSAVRVAQAAVATANLNLTYCHIRAPFDGRVGLRQVDTGNYITTGDSAGIVVLTQTRPIDVMFTLPEDTMGSVAAKMRAGEKLTVDAYDRTQTRKLASGVLSTMDNQIDPTTGTFKLRAEFSNEHEQLFPNQFVNIRVLLDTVHDATVIPTSAVERGQQGTYVYVVSEEHTAEARPVKLGATEGERVAVQSGLKPGEQIVTDGADKLKEGQKVILNGEAGAAPGQKSGPPGGGKGGKGNWSGKKGGKARE